MAKNMKLKLIAVALMATSMVACNSQKKDEVDVNALIKQMTLDQKLDFIGGYKDFNIRGYEQLGIPEIRFADGPIGVRNYGPSTAYAASITLAAGWDKNLAYNTGKAIGEEARGKDVHVMLGPAMNIYRSPLCGRNFEYLGEDPYLAGQMAKEYIQGMQGEGVVATAKHFVANNQEFNRHHCSSDMDERTLREIYLPAFKTSVQEGKVGAIMTSYNLINGVHASQNDYLVNKILKGEWGFDGFVMSDWTSTYDGIACANGGLDLEMPWAKLMTPDTLKYALKNGLVKESVIDDKVRRILNTYNRFGFFKNPDISAGFVPDSAFIRKAALDAARGGMVLLRNENSFLPLDKSKIKTIAVIGPNNDPRITRGGGSSNITPLHPLTLSDAVQRIAGDNVKVLYEKGVKSRSKLPQGIFDATQFYSYLDGKPVPGVTADYYGNTALKGEKIGSKTFKKINLEDKNLQPNDTMEKNYSVKFSGYFKPEKSGAYCLGVSGDDGYRLYVDGKKVIDEWRNQGETPTKYECELKAGKEYHVEMDYYQAGGSAVIRMGAIPVSAKTDENQNLIKALAAAKQADIVIMSIGFNQFTEGEGSDRAFDLPNKQSELINEVAKVNPNVVVVLNAGGNVEMESWLNSTKALLHAWYPGQEGNLAAAEILFGITNPSGKLPASFERKLEDNPTYNSYHDTDNDLKVFYSEGLFVGYRGYDKSDVKPRYPFGFGLSYTTFDYSDAKSDKTDYKSGEVVKVSATITNTGNYDGAEAVQVYVSDKESSLERPIKELKDFAKVFLKKGESKEVSFELDKNAFSYYNPEKHGWVLEPGAFDILIGNSSEDIRQTVSININ